MRMRIDAMARWPLCLDHVTYASHGRDQLLPLARVDLLAQVVDHDVHDVRARIEVVSPRVLGDQRAAHHAPLVAAEVLEHDELLRRELHQRAAAPHLPRVEIELEIADLQDRRGEDAGTARERLDPREQLLEGEGLGDIVVGARAQRLDLRVDGVLRGQHEHGPLESVRAEIAQHIEPGPPGQPEVEHDQVERLAPRERFPFLAVGHEVDAPALLLEAALHELPDRRVVLDDENSHWIPAPAGRSKPYSRIFRYRVFAEMRRMDAALPWCQWTCRSTAAMWRRSTSSNESGSPPAAIVAGAAAERRRSRA